MRRAQITVFIILGLVLVISVSLLLYVSERQDVVRVISGERSARLGEDCEEGTLNRQCAPQQPLQCRKGVLRPNCASCGCPVNELCNADGTCGGRAEEVPSNFTFYIIPLGYAPDDRVFLRRAEILKISLLANAPLQDYNFVVVEETLDDREIPCIESTRHYDRHVQRWLQRRTGKGLPRLTFEGGIPVYKYRLVGISDKVQDTQECGCAYTTIYSPNIYVGGAQCSMASHVAVHEFGHTIGLCDEYDTCEYDRTDIQMREAFGHPCLNSKPNAFNSNCGIECCSTGGACCQGKYAETKGEGAFNVMGSAEVPPQRKVSKEMQAVFKTYFCNVLGVCA